MALWKGWALNSQQTYEIRPYTLHIMKKNICKPLQNRNAHVFLFSLPSKPPTRAGTTEKQQQNQQRLRPNRPAVGLFCTKLFKQIEPLTRRLSFSSCGRPTKAEGNGFCLAWGDQAGHTLCRGKVFLLIFFDSKTSWCHVIYFSINHINPMHTSIWNQPGAVKAAFAGQSWRYTACWTSLSVGHRTSIAHWSYRLPAMTSRKIYTN